jgi:hypothetical protein
MTQQEEHANAMNVPVATTPAKLPSASGGASNEAELVVTLSPAKRHHTVECDYDTGSDVDAGASCAVCHSTENISYWLGCGFKNRITNRETCGYWVHQKCSGLHFQIESQLAKVPFYCPNHGPPTATSKRGKGGGKGHGKKSKK